ncbi:xylose isomerase [Spirochaeta africana]|uniref:Xylose isomerase n=1 Tax=Spirochaeta africana (strain ATCC 700263 / DSM 8902 / Z-7692) TaxID=889378 RepID=H9ULH0_SPIAZ|nr:xylose isomerase [Spirochaeta africana]AFG38363.1 xylose isomerase [Spirochaeta africana DSM 8902]
MKSELFPEIPVIPFEGPQSRNPCAFKHYDPDELVGGKPMKDHLRFSMAFWHTMNAGGTDPFGAPTAIRPWDGETDPMRIAELKMRGLFELTGKLNIPYFCFHDTDIAPAGATLRESHRNLDHITGLIKQLQQDSPLQLLWGTANLFTHPRYMHGAATSPDTRVYAYAAGQVRKAIEVTKELNGENYVFWGGREGYETLLNTDMKRELDNLARFMHMAVDYAREIGFTGQFLFEPKPKEPTKHQYDTDSATVHAFLQAYDLLPHVKLNIETNHATLAGHTIQHELQYARIHGILGSVDANQGDTLLGWDTDQFPTDLYTTTLMMYEILKNGGLHRGGLNFDAKVRRPSNTIRDVVVSHIVGMDSFARGLKAAHAMLQDRALEGFIDTRYASWDEPLGREIQSGTTTLQSLEQQIIDLPQFLPDSGQQEYLESLINGYL